MTYELSDAPVTPTSPLPLLTNLLLAPLYVCSSATRLITRATGASTSPPTVSSSLGMLFSMKQHFLSPFADPHLLHKSLILPPASLPFTCRYTRACWLLASTHASTCPLPAIATGHPDGWSGHPDAQIATTRFPCPTAADRPDNWLAHASPPEVSGTPGRARGTSGTSCAPSASCPGAPDTRGTPGAPCSGASGPRGAPGARLTSGAFGSLLQQASCHPRLLQAPSCTRLTS